MKKVLIIKTSSLGDVIHTLPALTDAAKVIEGVEFDWVVEQNFAEIASWHASVSQVIPVKLRQWRKSPLKILFSDEWKAFKARIKATHYDAIIDAQGLIKSALLLPLTRGPRYGLDKHSAREALASRFYDHKIAVSTAQHAVERTRQLFAKSLGYPLPDTSGDYAIKSHFDSSSVTDTASTRYIVLLHGTTWDSKHYPEPYWQELIQLAESDGLEVKLLWGNETEYHRAQRLADQTNCVTVMPKLNLTDIARLLASAKGAIACDTGLGHLAAAVDCPTVSLFTSTNPGLSGAYGIAQKHLFADYICAPCMLRNCDKPSTQDVINQQPVVISPPCAKTIDPQLVWKNFKELLQVL